MRVLIVFGSSRGGTAGLAQMVADALRDDGVEVDVAPADESVRVLDYDAVVVGGALYAFRWHKAARRFVKRHTRELRQRPTYFFSSGPLDDSASRKDIAPVSGVAALMKRVDARGHVTFGGRLLADAKGFPAGAMAKKNAGDWRDIEQVCKWADSVTAELQKV